jgi:hypothetical protein
MSDILCKYARSELVSEIESVRYGFQGLTREGLPSADMVLKQEKA